MFLQLNYHSNLSLLEGAHRIDSLQQQPADGKVYGPLRFDLKHNKRQNTGLEFTDVEFYFLLTDGAVRDISPLGMEPGSPV